MRPVASRPAPLGHPAGRAVRPERGDANLPGGSDTSAGHSRNIASRGPAQSSHNWSRPPHRFLGCEVLDVESVLPAGQQSWAKVITCGG